MAGHCTWDNDNKQITWKIRDQLPDQLYQYGEAERIRITNLGKERFEEDDTPALPDGE